jgi:hypothetical protein
MNLWPQADFAPFASGMKINASVKYHPMYGVLSDLAGDGAPRAFVQQDLWHYNDRALVDACASHGIRAFYGPFLGDLKDARLWRGAISQCVYYRMQLARGRWRRFPDRHSAPGVQPGGNEVLLCR